MVNNEGMRKAIEEAKRGKYKITDSMGITYKYGENPYADMRIELAILMDLYPEYVESTTDFLGFNRNEYILENEENNMIVMAKISLFGVKEGRCYSVIDKSDGFIKIILDNGKTGICNISAFDIIKE